MPGVSRWVVVTLHDKAGAGRSAHDPMDYQSPSAQLSPRHAIRDDVADAVQRSLVGDDQVAVVIGGEHAVAVDDNVVHRSAQRLWAQHDGAYADNAEGKDLDTRFQPAPTGASPARCGRQGGRGRAGDHSV